MKINKKILAPTLLILAAFIWGISFVIMKGTLDSIKPAQLIAVRFSISTLILSVVFIKSWKKINKKTIIYGLLTGIFLGLAYIVQTFGLANTTPGKNAFITSLYCLMVPFLYWLFNKTKPNKYNFIAVGVAVVGLLLLSYKTIILFSSVNIGDLLTFFSSIFYGLHIVFTNKYCKEYDVKLVTIFQFVSVSVMAWITTFTIEREPIKITINMIPQLSYLIVLATCAALIFQNYGVNNMDPNQGALLLSFESVFAVIISIIIGYEKNVDFLTILGFVIIFIAIFISETQLKFIKKSSSQ